MKISVVGAGKVGAECAFLLAQEPNVGDVVLVDIIKELARGEALDISYSMGGGKAARVTSGDYPDTKGSDVIVICAGIPRPQPSTGPNYRDALLDANSPILKGIIEATKPLSPDAFYLIVANPVDLLVAKAVSFGVDRRKVAGVSTYHDTLRLRASLKHHGIANPKSFILGVHGNGAYIIRDKLNSATADAVKLEVNTAAQTIISLKKSSVYGVAIALRDTFRALKKGEIIASVMLDGEYGLRGVALSAVCHFEKLRLKSVEETPLGDGSDHFFASAKRLATFLS